MITLMRFGWFAVLTICVSQILFAQNWWEQEKARKQSHTQITYEGHDGNGALRALADFENQYMEFQAEATVNMEEMVNPVQAELMAKSAAELRAYAQAAKFISGLLVRAVYSTEKTLGKDELAGGKIEETLVKYARKIDEKVEWRGEAPLAVVKIGILFQNKNGLIDMVIPLVIEESRNLGISHYQPPSNTPASNIDFTGLIIDARGLNASPTIAPMILTGNDNRQVYGSLTVPREFAVEKGIAAYYKTFEDAKKDTGRLGNNPLVVKAEKTAFNNYHLWINEKDAITVYGADLRNGFLQECRVGVVLD